MIGRRKPPAIDRTDDDRAAAVAERMRGRGLEPSTAAGQQAHEDWAAEPPPPRPRKEDRRPPAREPFDQGESVGFVVERRRQADVVPVTPDPAPANGGAPPAADPAPQAPALEAPPDLPAAGLRSRDGETAVADVADPAAPQPAPEPVVPAAPPEPASPQPADPVEPQVPSPEPVAPQPAPEPDPASPAARRRPAAPRAARKGPRPGPPPRRAPGGRAAPPLQTRGTKRRPGRPPTAPRRPLPPAARPPSRGGRRFLALLVVVLVAALGWVGVKTFQPFHGDPSGAVAVTIPEGTAVGDIGSLLADRGVIDSGTFFSINATLTGRRGALKPGDYRLRRGMSYGAALEALTAGPPPKKAPPTFKLTLPEGLSRQELVGPVRKGGVTGDYLRASASPRALRRARRLGLPRGSRTTEGFLFPATYDLRKGADAQDLVAAQMRAFADNTAGVDYRAARRKNLTRYDVLIIASMVERETQLDRERPLVAAVVYNRLREGMPLGIDATIRYAENNWTRPLRVSELERPGPYNSRLNRGLPPTPIGNPGLASIKAAARPANVDYLYYVVKPGTRGHAFSSSDAEFERDRQRYEAAREANGGKSPTP